MKTRVTGIVGIGIALVTAAAIHAQDTAIKADVPFMFYVGQTLMPQGAYTVNESANGAVAWIRAMDADATKTVITLSVVGKRRDEPAKLVFHRYGEDYFLAEIWTGHAPTGQALVPSPREKELAHSGAGPTMAVIRVALHR